MARESPLNQFHTESEASFLAWGPPGEGALVVETFGELESEYAALRKGCVLIDEPQRGTVRVTGDDRLEFLGRMITQQVQGVEPWRMVRSFWLNRKGRIDADLRVVLLPGEAVLDVDVLAAGRTAETLGSFLFAEDVELVDASEDRHRLSLHGPTALAVLAEAAEETGADGAPALGELEPGGATVARIAGAEVVVFRDDLTAEPGLYLDVPTDAAAAVYARLVEAGAPTETEPRHRLRRAGWHALNIARIEAGSPVYNLDFGPDSLPAETGVLRDRVSFTKGCYLGQEVVARMDALGHPKKVLVALRIDASSARSPEAQPTTGAAVLPGGGVEGDDAATAGASPGEGNARSGGGMGGRGGGVGAVTSSVRSPMLGDDVVCLAMVKWGEHEPGREVRVETAAGPAPARVQPGLRSWPPAGDA